MRTLRAVAAGVLVVTLGGCTPGSDGPSPTRMTSSKPVAPVFERQMLGWWGADPETAQERALPWIRLDYDGEFAGFDGCNSVGGTWELDVQSRRVTAKVRASTDKACSGNDEASFERMTVDGTSLTYTVDGKSRTMQPRKQIPATMFVVERDSDLLVDVPSPVPPRGDIVTPEARAVAAVEALMAADSMSKGTYTTAWGTFCSPGRRVKSIESTAKRVVVTLTGNGGATCDLSGEGFALQRQQLAWTVIENLGVDAATPVRLMRAGDYRYWDDDVVADPSYLALPSW